MDQALVHTLCPSLNPLQRQYVLTFSGGPSQYTKRLVDLLAKSGRVATFYPIGASLQGNADALKLAIANGNVLASNTFSFQNLTQMSYNGIIQDIAKFDEVFYSYFGYKPRFLQPPFGSLNTDLANVLLNQSFDTIGWNIDPKDYSYNTTAEIVAATRQAILNNPGYPHIIYNGHDTSQAAVEALPDLINLFESLGYSNVALDKCMYGQSGPEIFSAVRSLKIREARSIVIPINDDFAALSHGSKLGWTWSKGVLVGIGTLLAVLY